jgi:hypothetical protein
MKKIKIFAVSVTAIRRLGNIKYIRLSFLFLAPCLFLMCRGEEAEHDIGEKLKQQKEGAEAVYHGLSP